MKEPLDKSDSRLMAAAIGSSVLLHAAAIGGWIWWENGHGFGTTSGSKNSREIQVQIRRAHLDVDLIAGPNNEAANRTSLGIAREQAGRVRSRANLVPAVSAARLLEDPATGLIFSAYFKVVKVRLARSAQDPGSSLTHDVSARFVLSRTGELLSVSTAPGASEADREAVRRLLNAAAPFPSFPLSIRHDSIAFDVLFRSDKNMLV